MGTTSGQDEAIQGWRNWVSGQLSAGRPRDAIVADMVAQGWEQQGAAAIVASFPSSRPAPVSYYTPQQQTRPAAQHSGSSGHGKNMLIGGVVCAIGIAVTFGTYASASSTGGRYTIAWGAILFGGIQFCRGLFGMMGGG